MSLSLLKSYLNDWFVHGSLWFLRKRLQRYVYSCVIRQVLCKGYFTSVFFQNLIYTLLSAYTVQQSTSLWTTVCLITYPVSLRAAWKFLYSNSYSLFVNVFEILIYIAHVFVIVIYIPPGVWQWLYQVRNRQALDKRLIVECTNILKHNDLRVWCH